MAYSYEVVRPFVDAEDKNHMKLATFILLTLQMSVLLNYYMLITNIINNILS